MYILFCFFNAAMITGCMGMTSWLRHLPEPVSALDFRKAVGAAFQGKEFPGTSYIAFPFSVPVRRLRFLMLYVHGSLCSISP